MISLSRVHFIFIMLLAAPLVTPSAADAAPAEPDHRSAPDPVRIDLAVPAAVAMGAPFALEATLTATWRDLPGTKVSLELAPGVTAAGATTLVIDLARDAPATLRFLLSATEAGAHALTLRASADTAHGALGGERTGYVVLPAQGLGAFHQDLVPSDGPRVRLAPVAAKLVPIEASGAAATSSDDGAAATSAARIPPPREGAPSAAEMEAATMEPKGGIGALGHSTFQLRVCWAYESEASPPVDRPQRGATIQVWDLDDISDDFLAEGVTQNDGCWTSPDIGREDTDGGADNQDVYVLIHLCNSWVCAYDADEDAYVYQVEYGELGGEDFIELGTFKAPGGDQFGSRAFQYAYTGGWFAVNHMHAPGFSTSGPGVDLWAPSTDDSCDKGGMFFRRTENRIHVCSDSDRSPEDVGHEFGHWVHWVLYGQDDDAWPSPGGDHNLCDDNQNRGLSWTEGWGNFYGPRAFNEVVAPSSDNNRNYDRPWDGSSFSIDMETGTCNLSGDDNEMHVAFSLWDIRDTEVDGVDTMSASNQFIGSVVGACNDANFRDLFDGGSCSWISQGGDPCNFVRASFQNSIDFDDNSPTASMTSQGAFAWVRGTVGLAANVADPDQGCMPEAEFRVSHDSVCDGNDTLAGFDIFGPTYTKDFDSKKISDDGSVWTCARASDGPQQSPWSTSTSHIGVDNTPPSVGGTLGGTLGNEGWHLTPVSVTLSCSDGLSGVGLVRYWIDNEVVPTTYASAFTVAGEGSHTVLFECLDNAGNSDFGVRLFKIDTRDPATGLLYDGPTGENGWYVGDVTVTLSCTDPTPGSGCDATHVTHRFPGGNSSAFDYSAPIVVTGEGRHEIDHASEDVAGNVEATETLHLAIDTLPPVGEITGATDGTFSYPGSEVLGGLFTNEPTLTLSYHAADGASGLQLVSVLGDSDAYTGQLDANGTLTISLPPGISSWTVLAEDMAGHVATLGSFQVVSIPTGTFDGVDPRTSGWWKNIPRTGAYDPAALAAFLPLANVASHALGFPLDRYAGVTVDNYDLYLQSAPPSADERVRKELTAAWLNFVSGREPAAQAVDLDRVNGWPLVVTNTGGSTETLALNVLLEAERRLAEAPDDAQLNAIKNVLSALNSGGTNA